MISSFCGCQCCQSERLNLASGSERQVHTQEYRLEGFRWAIDPSVHPLGATVTWSIATANYPSDPFKFDTSIGDARFIAVIRDAFDAWERVTNINFVEVSDSSTVDIRLGYQNIDGPSGTLGEALRYYIGSELVESFIAFDSEENWNVNFGEASWGISAYWTALHEIGHAIGIDHSDDSGAIMYAFYNNAQFLTQDDIDAAQAIYGASVTTPTVSPVADLSTLINATDQNLSQFKGLTAAYSVLGGVPSIDGYRFLINRNNETNFGAGRDGPVFNDENIYINTVNALYQGNATARANADALLSTVETLNDRLSLIYDHIIPQDARSDEGRAHFLSQAEFYAARAAELGIEGPNGAAVVAFASLMKIAVDADIDGFGGSINDLVEAVGNGTAAIPVSGSNLTPIGTAIGGAPVGPVSLTSGTDAADGAGDGIDFASLNLPRVDDGNTHGGIDGPNTLVAEERANGSDVSNYVYSSMSEVPELGATGETDTAILSVISDDDGPNFVHGIGPEVEDMAWTDFI